MIKTFFLEQKVWLWPLLAFILITPFTPYLDLTIALAFYQNNQFVEEGFYPFIYKYGIIPAQFVFIIAIAIYLGSFFSAKLKDWRHFALVMILTLAVGAGLITHVLLKDHWGRPRPKQVIEFGGTQPFRPYYQPNFFHQPQPSKSFPCGHCTMGFYFFAVALIGWRLENKSLFYGGLVTALFLGLLLSIARMSQGGHFLSDTLAGALVMWLTAYVFVQWIPINKAFTK